MQNDPKWLNYRLSDIFKGYCRKSKQFEYLANIQSTLPDSIAGQYIARTSQLEAKNQDSNFEILEQILQGKFPDVPPPAANEIVLHLRVGDVINGFQNGEVTLRDPAWGITIAKLSEILGRIEKTQGDVINILYGSHKAKVNKGANEKYLDAVRALLIDYGFTFYEKNSTNPDRDFLYMCRSQRFIESGGGFSQLVKNLVVRHGGRACE